MAASACAKCGAAVGQSSGRGRPRRFCFDCSPRKIVKAAPRPQVVKVCEHCGVEFGSINSPRVRFCSSDCRQRVTQRRPCAECGALVWWNSVTSAKDPICRGCRIPDHGAVARYKRGCRCAECTEAKRVEHVAWREKREASGKSVKRRARRDCVHCGEGFLGRLDTGQRFCSVECAKLAQGYDGVRRRRFRVPDSVRRAIFEASGWACTLCASPVRPDEDPYHPRYPTLDHVLPRSRGGSDDPSNLRLACRQCNTLRGSNVDWVPEKAVA